MQLPAERPDHLRGPQDGSKRWYAPRIDVRRLMLRRGLPVPTTGDDQAAS